MRERRPIVLPELVAGTVSLAVAQGLAAVRVLGGTHVGADVVVTTFATAAGIVALPLLVLAVLATLLVQSAALVRVRTELGLFLAGGRRELLGVAVVLYALAFGEALVWSAIVVRKVAAGVRIEFGAIEGAVITTFMLAVCAVGACVGVHVAGLALRRAKGWAPLVDRVTRAYVAPLAVGAIGVSTAKTLLPAEVAGMVAAVWAVGALSCVAPIHTVLARLVSGGRGAVIVAFGMVASASSYPGLVRLPGAAQLAVERGPELDAVLLAVIHKSTDHDGDGYSSILGGGDCDDRDPHVYPGAHDIPGNGRDEDCSGADATPFVASYGDTAADAASYARVERTIQAAVGLRPNIVVVQLDAVRPDHVGFTGYARATTPEIDRFRAGATWFERAYAPGPSTQSSMTGILTGADVARAAPPGGDDGSRVPLRADVRTVAERLADQGYDRVGVTVPYVLERMRGIEKGFRVWESAWPADDDPRRRGLDAKVTADEALVRLDRLSADRARPYLLYVHFLCAHQPYVGDPDHDFGKLVLDAYDGALATCDHHVGRVLRALEARPDRDRTAVFVVSDHGELLGEHGFVGHGTELYEPAVRALLVARVPGLDQPTVESPVSLTDLAPTMLALAGAPADDAADARDLLPVLAGRAPAGRPIFLYEDARALGLRFQERAVVDGRYKYVRDVTTGIDQLFDLSADPSESVNLRRELPTERARLAGLLESWSAYVTGG